MRTVLFTYNSIRNIIFFNFRLCKSKKERNCNKIMQTQSLGASAPTQENKIERVLDLSLFIGKGMLESGASVSRVENAIERICSAYNAKSIVVFSIPSLILATIEDQDGNKYTQSQRVYKIANDLFKLERYNQLSRDICSQKIPVKDALERAREVRKVYNYPFIVPIVGGGAIAGGFTLFFGGTFVDVLPAFIIGALMVFINVLFFNKSFNSYASTFMLSFMAGALAILTAMVASALKIPCHTSPIMIGTIMVVVPGLLVCNAVRDLFVGDLLSGSVQILNGVITTLAIVAGYGVAMSLIKDFAVYLDVPTLDQLRYYLYTVSGCLIGTLGVCLFFKIDKKRLFTAMLNTAITYGAYLLFYTIWSDLFACNLIATVIASIISEIMARIEKAPASVFLVPAIIPLVPGGMLYRAMNSLIIGDFAQAGVYGFDALLIFLGIALGLSLIAAIFQLIAPIKFRKRYAVSVLANLFKNTTKLDK